MFRYYITDLGAGMVYGTSDPQVAQDFSYSEDHYVVDTELGTWLTAEENRAITDIKAELSDPDAE